MTWRNQQLEALSFIQLGKVMAVVPIVEASCVNGCKGSFQKGHAQWGQLTASENYMARKSETFARPTALAEDVGNGQVRVSVQNRHARYVAILNKQQQIESPRPVPHTPS
jgi:hypothetical protein